MTDNAFGSRGVSTRKATLDTILALAERIVDVLREWRQSYRSRLELASYSYDERSDLGFAAELDAEIVKLFWRK
jgi:uncharacterized protein YjiS (DUF1127 family)